MNSGKEEAHMSLIKAFAYSISFVMMVFGTYIFSMGDDKEKVIPYVLCCYFFVFLLAYIVVNIAVLPTLTEDHDKSFKTQIKMTFNDVNCLIIAWLFWLTYGVVFFPIYDLFGNLWILIQTLILVILVLLSYVPQVLNNKIHSWADITIYTIVVLFFFSKDGISVYLTDFVLITKVVLFTILYIINDYKLKIPDRLIKNIGKDLSKKFRMNSVESRIQDDETDDDEETINIKEEIIRLRAITLMRSYWVLSCSNRLIIFSVFQISIILVVNYCSYAEAIRNKSQMKSNQDKIALLKKLKDLEVKEEEIIAQPLEDVSVSKRQKSKPKSQPPPPELKEKPKKKTKKDKNSDTIPSQSVFGNISEEMIEHYLSQHSENTQ